MQLPFLRQMKRLLPFLGLGISTTLLILVLSLIPIPSNAQLIRVDPHPLFPGSGGDLVSSTQNNLPAQVSQSNSPPLDLVQQGKSNYQKGQIEQALTLWQQAASAFAAQGDRLHEAMTRSYLAQGYQQLGAWNKANDAIAQSLELLKQPNQGNTGEGLHILAEAQTIQGSLQFDQGQVSEAFTSWQQAANTFQQVGDFAGIISSQINQSQALVSLGLYKRANNLLESMYKKLPPEEPLQLAILLNYGETLRLVGHLQEERPAKPQTLQPSQNSATILKQGLELAQKLKAPVEITKAQISLGNTYRAIYQQQKRLQPNPCTDPKVLAYLQNALQYYQQAAEETDSPTSKIQALSNQQSLLLATRSDYKSINGDNDQQILAIAVQIQAQLNRLPLNRVALYTQIQLAYNLLQLDQTPPKLKDNGASNQAAQILEVAVKQAEKLGDQAAQSYALGYLGQAYDQQQQGNNALKLTAQALDLTTKALNLAKTINAPEIAYRWFWQLGRLDRANNPERAIKNYRQAYNTLQVLRTDLAFDNTDLQFSFQEHPVEQAYREFADLLLQPEISETKEVEKTPEAGDKNKLQEAREVMRSLQTTELQNFLQEPCAEAKLEQIDEILDREENPDLHTAILSPILFSDRIEVVVKLRNQELFHYRTNLPEATAKDTISKFQRDLQESYTFDAVKDGGKTIYEWLIKPAEKQLEKAQIKTIVFVLDAPFRNIPMAALYDGEHYLIEKYAVSISLGLDLSDAHPLPNDRLKVLAGGLTKALKLQFRQFQFPTLEYVDAELSEIEKTPKVSVTKIEDDNFTRDLFNQKFNDSPFQIVHLATHGQFSSNPQDTFILTAPNNLVGDGKVRLKDFDAMFRTRVLNRADAIEMLILSACETASGDDRATLGIAGAAVKAGARSAIASLWSLDDKSSPKFFSTFYNSITQPHTSRAEALRQAQVALLADSAHSHPRYWAPFLLVGNWL